MKTKMLLPLIALFGFHSCQIFLADSYEPEECKTTVRYNKETGLSTFVLCVDQDGPVSIAFYHSTGIGDEIYNEHLKRGKHVKKFKTSHLDQGAYFVLVKMPGKEEKLKVIIN